MKKLGIFLISVILLAVGLSFNALRPQISHQAVPDKTENRLRVVYLDVGQGDSALIITPGGQTVLVDGGPGSKVLSRMGAHLPYYQKKIDRVILTHPHADHLEGLIPVLERFEVGEIYYSGAPHTTDEFIEWLKLIKEKNISLHQIKSQKTVELDNGVKMKFLYPDWDLTASSTPANLNNTSIVFQLVYQQNKFLFMGDAELPVEGRLLSTCGFGVIPSDLPADEVGAEGSLHSGRDDKQDALCDLRSDVIKIGHHGSNSSSGEEFISAVAPQIAVISVGKDNDFGHPHLRTLRRLERLVPTIYRTDWLGDVELVSDGKSIQKK